MSIRIASYNVMNLFHRPCPMNLGDWRRGRAVLEDIVRLNELLSRERYTPAVRSEIRQIYYDGLN